MNFGIGLEFLFILVRAEYFRSSLRARRLDERWQPLEVDSHLSTLPWRNHVKKEVIANLKDKASSGLFSSKTEFWFLPLRKHILFG